MISFILYTYRVKEINIYQRDEALICSITPVIGDLMLGVLFLEGVGAVFEPIDTADQSDSLYELDGSSPESENSS